MKNHMVEAFEIGCYHYWIKLIYGITEKFQGVGVVSFPSIGACPFLECISLACKVMSWSLT